MFRKQYTSLDIYQPECIVCVNWCIIFKYKANKNERNANFLPDTWWYPINFNTKTAHNVHYSQQIPLSSCDKWTKPQSIGILIAEVVYDKVKLTIPDLTKFLTHQGHEQKSYSNFVFCCFILLLFLYIPPLHFSLYFSLKIKIMAIRPWKDSRGHTASVFDQQKNKFKPTTERWTYPNSNRMGHKEFETAWSLPAWNVYAIHEYKGN